ncbi:guanylate kinase [Candidatus Magnetominusculus dajiuhuensis]|uniref:guanylate kinase n=1 Tax=Candidatus Magnetominusculus dajiuhuensis TaxID=3137712 RepID=UPI003B43A23C
MYINNGRLYILSAPSGTGKTTISGEILKSIPHMKGSVSFTTRQPRAGERNDIDYTFISVEAFHHMLQAGEFIESAEVHGNYYGTSIKRIKEIQEGGSDVLLDIDTHGAKQIRARHIDATYIFILPPSLEALRERLYKRNLDDEKSIIRRLAKAKDEIRECLFYDYIIVNDDLRRAVDGLKAIILSGRLRADCLNADWFEGKFGIQ